MLEPYPDQWAYLAGARRRDTEQAAAIAGAAEQTGGTLGLAHWTDAPPTRTSRRSLTSTHAPAVIEARLEIALSGLPAELCDRLRRTAAFPNPVFFEREQARLSTHIEESAAPV